jgi:hypothetical protein
MLTAVEGSFNCLVGGVTPSTYQFVDTFLDCANLRTIPENLFKGLGSPMARRMFSSTFGDCKSLTSIPAKLFKDIKGVSESGIFAGTFSNCTSLTSIPAELFRNLKDIPAGNMFYRTFDNCISLTGQSAKLSNGQYLYQFFPSATIDHVKECYFNCTGLSDYDNIPTVWK